MTQLEQDKWRIDPTLRVRVLPPTAPNTFSFFLPKKDKGHWSCPRPAHCWACEEGRHLEISKTVPYWGA